MAQSQALKSARTIVLALAVAGTLGVVPWVLAQDAAVPVAPVSGASASTLSADVADFWHFARIGRYDAANAKAKAVLVSGAAPVDVLAAFEAVTRPRSGEQRSEELATWFIRWRDIAEIKENVTAFDKLLGEGRFERRSDPQFIKSNIERLIVNQIGYQNGVTNLRTSGELAVPILLDYLKSPAQSQYHDAIRRAIRDLGQQAIAPLVAATQTTDLQTLQEVATLIGDLGYEDASPYLLRVHSASTSTEVKAVTGRALQKLGISESSPADAAFLALAEKIYSGKAALLADTRNPQAFVWFWSDTQGLTKTDVPPSIYDEVMTLRSTEYALENSTSGSTDVADKALSLWLAANYRREIQLPEGMLDATRGENQPDAHYYGVTAGTKFLGAALERALNDRDPAVAYAVIRSSQQVVGKSNLNISTDGASLVKAMSYPDRRVRFEAAFALASARPVAAYGGSESVVPLLGEALSQTGEPTVLVILDSQDRANTVGEALKASGYVTANAANATDAASAGAQLPSIDVVVISSKLPTDQVQAVMSLLGSSTKYRGSARLVLTDTTESSFEEMKASDPLLSTAVAFEPADIQVAIESARTQAGALPVDEAVATDYALRAAELLHDVGLAGGIYDLSVVKPTLLGSLEDPRADVLTAVGSVLAIFDDAEAQKALYAKASSTDTAADLRVVLYKALAGNSRTFGNRLPASDIDGLEKTVTDEADLAIRSAAAEARGALSLSAEQAKSVVVRQARR